MRLVCGLSDAKRAHIDWCGFKYLLQMPDIHVNHRMLTVLVDCFHLEHSTFHLLVGEMTIMPEDINRILRILFNRDKVDYDSTQRLGVLALRWIFHDNIILESTITWDDLMSRYGEQYPLACILVGMIGCFIMPNRGQ